MFECVYNRYMGLVARKPDFVACEQQRDRPEFVIHSHERKMSKTCYMQSYNILASLYR